MSDIIEATFQEWTQGKNPREARIAVFNKIRDIPYAVLPELNDPTNYIKILDLNRGSCTPKHFLLCDMFHLLGLEVLYVVYRYRWDEFEHLYPPELRKLAREMPLGYHLACKVDIDDRLVLVDATIDPAMALAGLPVNKDWDGFSDTLLPVNPCGEEELYYRSEANTIKVQQVNDVTGTFYKGLNAWMEQIRAKKDNGNFSPVEFKGAQPLNKICHCEVRKCRSNR